MGPLVRGCASAEELLAFAQGHLPTSDLEALGSHIDCCPSCEGRLKDLEDLSDPLLAEVRRAAGRPGETYSIVDSGTKSSRTAPYGDAPAAVVRDGGPPETLGRYRLL